MVASNIYVAVSLSHRVGGLLNGRTQLEIFTPLLFLGSVGVGRDARGRIWLTHGGNTPC